MIKYTWLKILDTLKKHTSRTTVGDLRRELDARGFRMGADEFADDLVKLRELGLVESDILVTTDAVAATSFDDYSSVGITAAGLRKVTSIVKI
ncbi:MAG: hypothetical protein E6K13_02020 [Methanobacteriota archaeon]|nr:MAG: hypothetical protein E6K13_02020 [Euryarchaeota archaeon]